MVATWTTSTDPSTIPILDPISEAPRSDAILREMDSFLRTVKFSAP